MLVDRAEKETYDASNGLEYSNGDDGGGHNDSKGNKQVYHITFKT